MSAYVVEDMIELSQAHATYRFIVCDEEEEKPRLLVSVQLVRVEYSWLMVRSSGCSSHR